MQAILRENLGVLAAAIVFVLVRKRKTFFQPLLRILNPIFQRFRSILLASPLIYGGHTDDQRVFHFKRRFLGFDYAVVRSPQVATGIRDHIQNFENTGFVSQSYQFARQLSGPPSSNNSSLIEAILRDELNRKNKTATSASLKRATKTKSSKATRIERAYLGFEIHPDQRRSPLVQPFSDETFQGIPSSAGGSAGDAEHIPEFRSLDPNADAYILTSAFPLIKSCIKELIVLLEAKSNRKNIVDLKSYCRRHCVNVAAVCVFGRSANELTGSASKFYENFDRIYDLWLRHEKAPLRWRALRHLGWRQGEARFDDRETGVEYFKNLIENSSERHETSDGHESCLASSFAKLVSQRTPKVGRNEQVGKYVLGLTPPSSIFEIIVYKNELGRGKSGTMTPPF